MQIMRRNRNPEIKAVLLNSTKTSIKWSDNFVKKIAITLIILCCVIADMGCARFKGEFAFKIFFEDQYKKKDDPLEFEKSERINWVYIFKQVNGVHDIGVSLIKKELVWVDISNKAEQISGANKVIYGKIENLSDGTYKIVLSEADKVIDEREFIIYTDDTEPDN